MNVLFSRLTPLALLTAVETSASLVTAQTFNPANDFSTSANPVGVWSYGWSPSLGGPFHLDEFFATSGYNFSDLDMWQGRQTAFYYPFVAHNSTAVPQSLGGTATFQPGDLALHPGAGGEISILRWTAPAPGSYSVMAAFRGIDVGPTTTDVHVLRNGVSLFDGAVSALGTGPTYAGVLTVSSGDTIDFAVGYGANHTYLNDSTGLNASLVAVPESVSLVLAGVGVAALAPFIGRRFHRSLEDERM